MENNKLIMKWHIIGFLFITILGSFLHFFFELTGFFYPIGAIAAVNESVWEHLKLIYFPIVFFAPLEYIFLKDYSNNFNLAKAAASYIAPLSIVVIFYTYTAILGTNLLIIDILTFILSALIAQILSYKILTSKALPDQIQLISLILIVLLGFLFVIFTYFPPHLPIFRDSLTGTYGISEHGH